MAKKTLLAQVRIHLEAYADSIGQKKDGTIVVRRGFFYRNGNDSAKFAINVAKLLAELPVVMKEHGEHYSSFRGGASVANSSHWWVEFVAI
jgi:hypothetical protein